MTLDPRQLRADSRALLCPQLQNARKLALISQGALLGVNLLLCVLEVLLETVINENGGLSGMGLRSALSTVTTMCSLAISFLSPFWSIGILFVFLGIARRENPDTQSLFEGFRRFGPVLRYRLLTIALIAGLSIGIVYLYSILSTFLPTNPEFAAFIQENQDAFFADPEAVLAQMPQGLLFETVAPGVVILCVLFLSVLIPLSYRLRLGEYALMDKSGTGALAALSYSMRTMKGHCVAAFKLDLNFWWYYLAIFALSAVAQLDMLLPELGIALPFTDSISRLIFYAIYSLGALALTYYAIPQTQAAYAKFYVALQGE